MGAPFQSTLPVGEATGEVKDADGVQIISIHASRGGSDFEMTATRFGREIFQSTLPVGEATAGRRAVRHDVIISIHASRGGSDFPRGRFFRLIRISIHASRGGSDTIP